MEEILKILVVDDDEVDRMAVRRALQSAGIEMDFSEVGDYATAIATLQDTEFDCIFLDYRLPDKDGLTLIQDVRHDGIKTPLVVLTGQGDEQLAVELMKAGASDYLPKSKILPETLARILRSAIRLYQAEKAAASANYQREQLFKQREDFVYSLTHDLRTPLVAADRIFALFKQEAFGPVSSDMHAVLNNIVRNNQDLLQMVNNILEVYRHDTGQKALNFSPWDLRQIIQEVLQELLPVAQEKEIELTADLDKTPGTKVVTTIMGDRIELKRVLTNLVGYAIKYTGARSVVIRLIGTAIKSISEADQGANWVTIEIQDTGAGISPEEKAFLFERYRQDGSKRSGAGLLELYLSRVIIEAHKGTIAAASEPGQGSVFTIRLPTQQF